MSEHSRPRAPDGRSRQSLRSCGMTFLNAVIPHEQAPTLGAGQTPRASVGIHYPRPVAGHAHRLRDDISERRVRRYFVHADPRTAASIEGAFHTDGTVPMDFSLMFWGDVDHGVDPNDKYRLLFDVARY